jgi:TRAP-type C4-dicarboxylate transport system substrate-binding protein
MPLPLRRRTALALAGSALAAPWIGGTARAAGITWNAYTYQYPGSAGVRGLTRLAEQMTTSTGGAFTLMVNSAGRLGVDVNAMTQAIANNVVQLGDDAYHGLVIAAAGIPRLPMLVANREAFLKGSRVVRTFLAPLMAARNSVLLGHYGHPRMLTWSRLPFETLLGVSGHRIRSLTAEHGEFIRRLGGAPVAVVTGDVAAALTKTNIDTIFSTAVNARQWRAKLRFAYASGPNHLDAVLHANKDAFAALPRTTQDALSDAATQTAGWIMDTLYAEEEAALKALSGDGLTPAETQTTDVQTVTQKCASIWDEWSRVRGRETQDLLFAFRRAVDQ